MKRQRAERLGQAVLKPTAILTVIVFVAITCVSSSIVAAGYSKPDSHAIAPPVITDTAQTINSHALESTESDVSKPTDEWEVVRMRVTAYCPCRKCCGKYADGVTACGHQIQPGDFFVAADRNYPFGTKVSVPGYNSGKPVKVLDRGGAIRGDRLDVFFPSHAGALKWGVKYLDVKVQRVSIGV